MDALNEVLALELTRQQVQISGEVLACPDADLFLIRTGLGEFTARRALSCLVRPEIGDSVLVAEAASDQSYVIAVLARRSDAPLHLALSGQTRISTEQGAGLSIEVDGQLGLSSRTRIETDAPELLLRATTATLVCRRFSAVIREALPPHCAIAAGLEPGRNHRRAPAICLPITASGPSRAWTKRVPQTSTSAPNRCSTCKRRTSLPAPKS